MFTLNLSYKPPLDWKSLLQYYSKHQIPFIEEVSETHYQRVFRIDSSLGVLKVENESVKAQLKLTVYCPDPEVLFSISHRIKNMFDLNSDPLLISNQFSTSPFLKDLWNEFPGLRIARGWDPYEIAVGAILGQVVSVKQASCLMGEVVRCYGEKISHPLTSKETYLFPIPHILAEASLAEIKTTEQRKKAVRKLSKNLIEKKINFDEYQDLENLKNQLRSIHGIGSWSVEYISLRGFGDNNAFPKDDLVLKRALELTKGSFNLVEIEPWKGYLAIYLWQKYAGQSKERKNEKI